MPAPSFLKGLPKPALFGLYGAVGGLLGALVFAEILYRILTPPAAPLPPKPEPQVAISASKEVEVFVEGRNTIPVQIARESFTGPVTVRLEELPPGVTADAITIPADKTQGEVLVIGTPSAAVGTKQAKAVVEANADGMKATAETSVSFKVTNPPRPLADIVFVLDVTISMQFAIDDLKNGIGKFADALAKARVDFRLGLVTFQDIHERGEKVEVVLFDGDQFTAKPGAFRDKVATLKAGGGGKDIPESSLEGVAAAAEMPYRQGATKMMLLITDAPPKVVPEANTAKAVRDTAALLTRNKIDSANIVVFPFDKGVYQPILDATPQAGKYFDLKDVVVGEQGLDALLTSFGAVVGEAAKAKNPDSTPQLSKPAEKPTLPGVKSLQSSEQLAAGTEGRIILRSGVWTGAIAALVCLALVAGQHHYLRGSLPAVGGILAGIVGGLVVGFVGGAAGEGLYTLSQKSGPLSSLGSAFQVLGWALLGGLAGIGLSLFIPNMKWTLGLAGGAIGGAAGMVGFLVVSTSAGDLVGRLVGGLILGFCIGLMVAIVEAAFRKAWLEVRFGARETITVNLGPEPVKVGGDAKACTVWARGAASVALRFFIRDGKVICDDTVMKRETPVADGFSKEVGNVTVTVHTGSSTATPTSPRPASPAAAPPRVAPKPMSLDDDDDGFDLPMPMSPTAPPKPAAIPVPVSPPPAAPVATVAPKPPIPAPAPAARKPPDVPTPAASKPVMPPVPPKPAPPAPPRPAAPPMAKPAAPPPPKPASPPPASPVGPKHPDACPSCGRVNAGKPKTRYCMVCDNTY